MAKPKRASAGSGLRKNHGPKRKLFKEYKPMIHVFAKSGLLNKYNSEESFLLAVASRGNKKVSHADWESFKTLSYKEKEDYFKNLRK